MKRRNMALAIALIAALVALVLPAAALAADNSNGYRIYYEIDNHSDGYRIAYPHNAWRGFDMAFYKGQVWQSFYPGGASNNLAGDKIGVAITQQPAEDQPKEKPPHSFVAETGETWTNTDRRLTADRLTVFRDRLFLYIAKSGTDTKGFTLTQKELDGINWAPEPLVVWQDPTVNQSIRGLVVEVMNDTLVILFQKAGSRDLYLITSPDAATFSRPVKVHTFSANDCLLNGEVIARGTDGRPLLAFVTKDDVALDSTTGLMKLWTFDLSTGTVAAVHTFANKYKDMVAVPGDILGCTPYDTKALQVWAIGSGTENLYHMQFVFNEAATGGTCTDKLDAGNVSKHVELNNRGYLAACPTAVPVTEPSNGRLSLEQRIRVWWWHDVNTFGTDAFGASAEYMSDYLKSTGERTTYFDKTDINDAWILQGVVTGLPPYYPNATEVGFLNDHTLLTYGIKQTNEIKTSLKSAATITVGFKSEFKHVGSVGFSFSNALERTTENEKRTEVSMGQAFGPDEQTEIPEDMGGMPFGAQAWGIFLVPDVSNEKYELWTPDKKTYLNVDVNYTYLKCGPSSLQVSKYDMTQRTTRSVEETPATFAYWQGIKTFPKSTDYWLWDNDDPITGTWINVYDHPDYELMRVFADPESGDPGTLVDPVTINASGSTVPYKFVAEERTTETQRFTSSLNVESDIFGFTTGLKGEISIEGSASSSVGTELSLNYGINGWSIDQLPKLEDGTPDRSVLAKYLSQINFDMYWLQAKSKDAFFVPAGAKIGNTLPWCITWHVNGYLTGDGSHSVLVSAVRQDVADQPQLPADLRADLMNKLEAARATYQAGDTETALHIVHEIRDLIQARSGKDIPEERAQIWLDFIEMILQITPTTPPFSDIASCPHKIAIEGLAHMGIINGKGDGTFRPGESTSRQQFAKMVVLSLALPVSETDTCTFTDVEQSGPSALYPDNYVAVAAANGITKGTSDTSFSPWANISRAQVITMIVRAAENLGAISLSEPPEGWSGNLPADDPTHGANICKAEHNGLLAGIALGDWDIWAEASRGEVAQMLWNMMTH